MAIPIANVNVRQMQGQRLVVLSSPHGEYTKGPEAVGVIVSAPAQVRNGGPQQGRHPMGNIYTVLGTDNNKNVEISQVRYIGTTPNGNYQFTTE